MKNIIDQLIILSLSITLYMSIENSIYVVIPVLTAIILSGLLSYFESESIRIALFLIYLSSCLFLSSFLFFIPLITYNVAYISKKWLWSLSFMPLIINGSYELLLAKALIGVFIITSYLLKSRTISLQKMKREFYELRDNTTEISLQLEKQNKELLARQDYEVNLATLTERNRIARDIHDNVGHMLSRSILQIAALLVINTDEKIENDLKLIKNTLSEAMDSIRDSVHDLHEDSINLEMEIDKLINNFRFCPIELDYNMKRNPNKNIKHCFIAVVKEALSNVIKHSNANKVSILVREHPGLYQLVIDDNGTKISYNSEKGIGIKNIKDRVSAVEGHVYISTDNGFKIFISVPKKSDERVD